MLIATSKNYTMHPLKKSNAVPKIKCSEGSTLFIVCCHLFKTTG